MGLRRLFDAEICCAAGSRARYVAIWIGYRLVISIESRVVRIGFVGLCVAVLALAESVTAQSERSVQHRVPADYMSFLGAQWLEREERVDQEQPEKVLDAMRLGAGDVVADVGCGSGYYARRIVPRVQPGGTVYCEDIQPEMLDIMQKLAEDEQVDGIRAVLGTSTDLKLPRGKIDWIIIADVYHEMSEPVSMLAGIRESLSPTGRVALLEYRVEDGTGDQIKADHTMSVRQVLDEWQDAGFVLVELHEFLPSQHLFFFRPAISKDDEEVLRDYDLHDAINQGVVEVEVSGADEGNVTVRIRRTGERDVVITSPAGAYFRSSGSGATRDMIARRDGWIKLTEDGWQNWPIRAVARQLSGLSPERDDRLELLSGATVPAIQALMQAIQTGTYFINDSPAFYAPRTFGMEQAAVWVADADLDYKTISRHINADRLPPPYAVAFALIFCDASGVDVTSRKIWKDREAVFGGLREESLNAWFQLKNIP